MALQTFVSHGTRTLLQIRRKLQGMTGKGESRLLAILSVYQYLELEVIYLFSDPSFSFDFYVGVTRKYVTLHLRS